MSLDAVTKTVEPDGIRFTGDKLEIYINRIYEKNKLIDVAKTVKTIGIFEYRLGDTDKFHGFFFPAVIEIAPSEVDFIKEGNDELLKLTLYKGDMFMTSRKVVKNEQIAYVCFSTYFEDGKIPAWLPYDQKSYIFDTLKKVTGINFPVDHAAFEIIVAHLNRCKNNIFKEYRFAEHGEKAIQLKLKDVAHAATTFTARSIGGYLSDSINVMLTHENTDESEMEDLLRGKPQIHNSQP